MHGRLALSLRQPNDEKVTSKGVEMQLSAGMQVWLACWHVLKTRGGSAQPDWLGAGGLRLPTKFRPIAI